MDGVLAGFWRRRNPLEIVVKVALTATQRKAVNAAAARLVEFSGVHVEGGL